MTTHWLYPANTKYYDVIAALSETESYWPIKSKVCVGDIIYIYLAAPFQQIAFICTVTDIDLEISSVLHKIQKFIKGTGSSHINEPLFMKFEVYAKLSLERESPLAFAALKQNGLKGMMMGARKLENNPQLMHYIRRNT